MIDKQTYLRFCDEALLAMRDLVVDLGDDLANTRPDLPGANSPYAILTHCLGVVGNWASTVNLGEVVPRDRDAEFTASGPVAGLAAETDRIRELLARSGWAARHRSRRRPTRRATTWTGSPPPRAVSCCTSTRSWPSTAVRWRSPVTSCSPGTAPSAYGAHAVRGVCVTHPH